MEHPEPEQVFEIRKSKTSELRGAFVRYGGLDTFDLRVFELPRADYQATKKGLRMSVSMWVPTIYHLVNTFKNHIDFEKLAKLEHTDLEELDG